MFCAKVAKMLRTVEDFSISNIQNITIAQTNPNRSFGDSPGDQQFLMAQRTFGQ